MRVLFRQDLFFPFVAIWPCSVDALSCRYRPVFVFPASRRLSPTADEALDRGRFGFDRRCGHDGVVQSGEASLLRGRAERRREAARGAAVLPAAAARAPAAF